MILKCEHCGTRYQLDETLIQPDGSKVRCSNCKRLWRVLPHGDTLDSDSDVLGAPSGAEARVSGAGAAMAGALAFEDLDTGDQDPGLEDLDLAGLGLDGFSEQDVLQTDELSFEDLETMLDMDDGLAGGAQKETVSDGAGADSGFALSELEDTLDESAEPALESTGDDEEISLDELEKMLEAEGGLLDDLDLDDETTARPAESPIGEMTTQDEISLADLESEVEEALSDGAFEPREEEDLVLDFSEMPDEPEVDDLSAQEVESSTEETLDIFFGETDEGTEDTTVDEIGLSDIEQVSSPADLSDLENGLGMDNLSVSDLEPLSPGGDRSDVVYVDLDLVSENGEVPGFDYGARGVPIVSPEELGVEELVEDTNVPGGPIVSPEELGVKELEEDTPFGESELDFELEPELVPELEEEPKLEWDLESDVEAQNSETDEAGLDVAPELQDLFGDEAPDVKVEETEAIEASSVTADLSDEQNGNQPASFEDMDFDLELSPEIEEIFDEAKDDGITIEETEELDLSSITSALDEKREEESESLEIDLDLDTDLSDDLSDDEKTRELDLYSIQEALETSGKEQETSEETELADLDDLELDLDLVGSEDEQQAPQELSLDFDADLSDDLSDDEKTRELDLDTLESMLGTDEEKSAAEPANAPDELDFELELDELADDAEDDATRELDLSDIERMLEKEPTSSSTSGAAEPDDAELSLDFDDDASAGVETGAQDREIDVNEIERVLDVESTTDKTLAPREDIDDLELDLDLSTSTNNDMDLELNFDLHDDEDEEPSALFDTSESEEIDFDLELNVDKDEGSRSGGDPDDDLDLDLDLEFEVIEQAGDRSTSAASTGTMVGTAAGALDLSDDLEAQSPPPPQPAPVSRAASRVPVRRRRSRRPLLIVLLLVVLGGAGYYLTQYTDIEIPYLSNLLGASSGVVAPVDASLKGYFIENTTEGQLYVIEGRVLNDTRTPVSFIEVTARVYANDKQFQRAVKSYCDNVLTREDLEKLNLADIQGRVRNRSGENNRNVRLARGSEVPFMAVFGNLPQETQLEEFTVEVSNSVSVQ